jgi:hypothetical protein
MIWSSLGEIIIQDLLFAGGCVIEVKGFFVTIVTQEMAIIKPDFQQGDAHVQN